MLAHSGSRVVFCEDAAQLAKIDSVRAACPDLEHRVVLTGSAPGAMTLDALRERGRDLDEPTAAARTAAIAARRRGHDRLHVGHDRAAEGLHAHARQHAGHDRPLPGPRWSWTAGMVAYLFLPLAHVLARVTQMVALRRRRDRSSTGAATPSGSSPSWPRRARRTSPRSRASSRRSTPPSWATCEEQRRLKRAVFAWALAEGRRATARAGGRASRPGALARRRHDLADRLVLSKVRGVFGEDLRLALTGAAPIGARDHRVLRRLRRARARGLRADRDVRGLDAQHGRASSASGPSGGRCPTPRCASPPTASCCSAGPTCSPATTATSRRRARASSTAGCTPATSARVDDDGFVRITGRKKELIITSSGKNISPTNIEELLRETRWISQAVVFGDNKPYLVALLTLDADEAAKLAEHAGRRRRRSRRARRRTRRSVPSCRPRSTPSTSGSRASSRSSASRSSTATSASPTASSRPR